MNVSLVVLILINMVIPAAETAPSTPDKFRASEVVRVLTPYSFECRLGNYKPAPSVRFRVSIPALKGPGADGVSKDKLKDRLLSAERVELRNVKFRSYFRVEAELWLDGERFPERSESKTVQDEKAVHKNSAGPTDSRRRTAARWKYAQDSGSPTQRTKPVQNQKVTVSQLLERQVDGSVLTGETSLSEALAILSESVEPRLPLLVLWKDLQENALIEKDKPIGVEGFGVLKLRSVLDIILRSVSINGPNLVLVAEGKTLTLGTEQTLLKHGKTKVYETSDLLSVPSTIGTNNRGGSGGRNAGSRR